MKTAQRIALSLLLVFFTSQPMQAQPVLGLIHTNNQFQLYWTNPGNGVNGLLQSTSSLLPSSWTAATDAVPVNAAGEMSMAVGGQGAATARFFRLSLAAPTSDGMACIPAGTFAMGDIAEDVSNTNLTGIAPLTNVYVSAFYMDTNLVSYGLWQQVLAYALNQGYTFTNYGSAKTANQENQPVESVDWYDCVKWCNARSQQAGLKPAYYLDSALTRLFTNGESDAVYVDWTASGYRLPTEAEWEKAARGGISGHRFPWGDTVSEGQANYYANSNFVYFSYDFGPNGFNPLGYAGDPPFTTPPGAFAANAYGLRDPAGNLEEWCWDWYDDVVTNGGLTNHFSLPTGSPYLGGADPHGPTNSPYGGRSLRSGAWYDLASSLRCASRGYVAPSATDSGKGFRCARKF